MSSTASSTASTTTSTTASTTVPSDTTEASVGTDPDTGYGTYGSSGGDSCRGIEIPEVCSQYVANYLECYPGLERYADFKAEYCACMLTYYGPMYGPTCGTAFEDYFACLSDASCQLMGGDDCAAEAAATDRACGGGEDSGGGGE